MKKKIFILIIAAALTATSTTAFAASIPRETLPQNATEEQAQIVGTQSNGVGTQSNGGILTKTGKYGIISLYVKKSNNAKKVVRENEKKKIYVTYNGVCAACRVCAAA